MSVVSSLRFKKDVLTGLRVSFFISKHNLNVKMSGQSDDDPPMKKKRERLSGGARKKQAKEKNERFKEVLAQTPKLDDLFRRSTAPSAGSHKGSLDLFIS